jgi:hypothetical protein
VDSLEHVRDRLEITYLAYSSKVNDFSNFKIIILFYFITNVNKSITGRADESSFPYFNNPMNVLVPGESSVRSEGIRSHHNTLIVLDS